VRDGVRSPWLSDTVRECQSLLNESLDKGPNQLPSTANAFLERLSPPRTPVERLVQRGMLLEVAVQFGHAAHATFHRQHAKTLKAAEPCGFIPSVTLEGWPGDLTKSPAEAFRRWAGRYAAAFRAAHRLSLAREAEQYVMQHFRSPIVASDLAKRLDCSTVFLRRTFQELTGRSLLEYQSELRLRTALRLLAETDWKVEAIASDVGYRSKKDLYRMVQTHLHCTPLEYRKTRSLSRDAAGAYRGSRG
jgi:AraC-like DNA-binding protein